LSIEDWILAFKLAELFLLIKSLINLMVNYAHSKHQL